MKCPRCAGSLRAIDYEGATIETCPGCGGEWLDGGELRQVVRTVEQTFPAEMKESLSAINSNTFSIDESPENQVSCPKCSGVELNRFNYACSSGIAIDKCPECDGIWLDRDEIENVQILVEEWRGKLEEDRATFAPLIAKMNEDTTQAEPEPLKVSRVGFINGILSGIVDYFARES
jgi:Zn-finger nucleic acid-binding protein